MNESGSEPLTDEGELEGRGAGGGLERLKRRGTSTSRRPLRESWLLWDTADGRLMPTVRLSKTRE